MCGLVLLSTCQTKRELHIPCPTTITRQCYSLISWILKTNYKYNSIDLLVIVCESMCKKEGQTNRPTGPEKDRKKVRALHSIQNICRDCVLFTLSNDFPWVCRCGYFMLKSIWCDLYILFIYIRFFFGSVDLSSLFLVNFFVRSQFDAFLSFQFLSFQFFSILFDYFD